jgi:hypothetical protein
MSYFECIILGALIGAALGWLFCDNKKDDKE